MPNITISVTADIKKRMELHREINWSAVARQAIEQKIALLTTMDMILADSELTQQDILRDAALIKKNVWKKHKSSKK